MMKPDIVVTVKTAVVRLVLDLPKRDPDMPVGNECRWIIGFFAKQLPAKTIREE